jgi:hypothetical protein
LGGGAAQKWETDFEVDGVCAARDLICHRGLGVRKGIL